MLTQKGKPWEEHAEELNEALSYYAYAKEFGWTPRQVRTLTSEEARYFRTIMSSITTTGE